MGLQEFIIQFDNLRATYEPGQTVSGIVILTIDSRKKFRALKLTIKGDAEVHWEERKSRRTRDNKTEYYTEYYRAEEEYFSVRFFLLGSSSGDQIELNPGKYVYPFRYVLNSNLPSSFESNYGYIRYTVKATIDRPWKFDQDTKVAFTVISHLDLNRLTNAANPLMIEKNKTFCCLCCGSKPLNINVSIPVRGYVPGQTIPVRVDVENRSGISIEEIKIKLQKLVTYTATRPHRKRKSVNSTILKDCAGPFRGNEDANFVKYLKVPSLPPANLQNCIIDVEYLLYFEACVNGCHTNVTAALPIIIGTIPLLSYQMPQPADRHEETNSGPAPSAPPLDEPPSYPSVSVDRYPNIAPPSYEECVFGTNNLRDHGESEKMIGAGVNFAPKYPVYSFKST